MDSSDFLGFLSARSSVREYEETPLSEDEITYIMSCAGTVPSAGNLEAWDVVVVTDAELRLALAEAAFGQEHVGKAPVLFVVCANYVRSMSQVRRTGHPLCGTGCNHCLHVHDARRPCTRSCYLLDRGV